MIPITFFFCLFGLTSNILSPSPPDELNELSGTHYIEVKTWVKHKECTLAGDLKINDKQKIVPIISMMHGYADDDWTYYKPSARGNLFVSLYNENGDKIFSVVVSSIHFQGKQSYFVTQINGPTISITESEFRELMALLDVDEDCAIVKNVQPAANSTSH